MNWYILIPLIVGIICAILGYLLGRIVRDKGSENHDAFNEKIAKLEADLEACKVSKSSNVSESITPPAPSNTSSEPKVSVASSMVASTVSNSTFDADAAKAVYGKIIKQDDLTFVEGIGPKIQELFHNHNIKTWKALSECSMEKCHQVLESGGDRFKMHVPGTWPRQARLAHQGKWQELSDWQDTLGGGK